MMSIKSSFLFTLIFILLSQSSFSQEKNEFRIYYGISDGELLQNSGPDGDGVSDLENFSEFGLRYLRTVTGNLALETGISYTSADIIIKPAFIGVPVESRKENLELVSIPIYANYTLWNYLFVNGGPLLDFQTSDNTTDSQSGIGYSIGIGGKYNFNDFQIFVNPNFKQHAIIPFEKENSHQKLTEIGILFGLGYRF